MQRPNKKEQYPLRIRSTIKRVVAYYPTGIMLKKDEWDGDEVIKRPNKAILNTAIRNKINELEQTFLEQSITGRQGKKIEKQKDPTFGEYAKKMIDNEDGVLSPGRMKEKRVYLKKFNQFRPGIKLRDINHSVMLEFERWCKTIKHNSDNTIWSNTGFVKNVLNMSATEGIFSVSPGKGFKGVKYIDPLRETLSLSEIALLEKFADDGSQNPKLRSVAAWFILGCYCGIRYGDMKQFQGIRDGKILLQTEKTNSIVSIFATEQIKKAYARIHDHVISNQHCNEYLKIIADSVNINKRLTMHVARHTFAVTFIDNEGRIEILSKIMGHSNIKTTAIYAKISDLTANKEMKKVFGE